MGRSVAVRRVELGREGHRTGLQRRRAAQRRPRAARSGADRQHHDHACHDQQRDNGGEPLHDDF